jgi:hypothetical protein
VRVAKADRRGLAPAVGALAFGLPGSIDRRSHRVEEFFLHDLAVLHCVESRFFHLHALAFHGAVLGGDVVFKVDDEPIPRGALSRQADRFALRRLARLRMAPGRFQ